MLEQNRVAINGNPPPDAVIPLVQFYSIELAPLEGGGVFVGIGATLSEGDGDLSNMEIVSQRVKALDEALRLITQTVRFAPRVKQ
jgi:hypothetical protein